MQNHLNCIDSILLNVLASQVSHSLLCCRTQPTNTLRSSLLMLHTMRSAMTQGSTGSARVSTSTVSFVVLPLLARSSGVSEEKVTCITRTGHLAGQPGRGIRPNPSADTAELLLASECQRLHVSYFGGSFSFLSCSTELLELSRFCHGYLCFCGSIF